MFNLFHSHTTLFVNQIFACLFSEPEFVQTVRSAAGPDYSPLGYFCRRCAGTDGLVENLAEGAAVSPRTNAVDAHVEVLAVGGIGVARVGHGDVMGHRGTVEGGDTWTGRGRDGDVGGRQGWS